MADNVDINFLGTQLERALRELQVLRDDNVVTAAMLARMEHTLRSLDGRVDALTAEVRVTHLQYARLDNRLRRLEDAQS